MILTFISPVISDAEHLFKGLLVVAPFLTIGVLSAWLRCPFDEFCCFTSSLCFYCYRCVLAPVAHSQLSALESRLSEEPGL